LDALRGMGIARLAHKMRDCLRALRRN